MADLQNLTFTGDLTKYIVPESDATNGGWYNYAGKIEYTPAATEEVPDPQPITVTIYERSIHYLAGAGGWYPEELKFAGKRYLAHVGGAWRVTTEVPTAATLEDATAWTEVEVQRADQGVAVPYCPGKTGDFGMLVPTDNGDVFHSLSNQFPGNMLRVVLDNLAGAQWEFYPMRRLIDLFATGATVEITATYNKEITSEGVSGDNGAYWGKYSDWDEDAEPTVEDLQDAPGRTIKSGRYSGETRTNSGTSLSYTASRSLNLTYAVWDEKRLMAELMNLASGSSGVSGTLRVHNSVVTETLDRYKVYRLRRPKDDAACAPWDYNYFWETTSATAEKTTIYTEHWAQYDSDYQTIIGWVVKKTTRHETFTYADGRWTTHGTKTVEETGKPTTTEEYAPSAIYAPGGGMHVGSGIHDRAQTDGDGVVHQNGFAEIVFDPSFETAPTVYSFFDLSVDDTGGVTKTATGSWSGGPYYDGDNYHTASETHSATFTFTQKADDPWDYDDPGPDYDDWVTLETWISEEKNAESLETTDGPSAESSTVTDKSSNIKAAVFFGEGRDSNDPHRPVVLSAAGKLGWSGTIAVASQSVTYTFKQEQTYQGKRTRGIDPSDVWHYDRNAPDGTTMTDAKWGTKFLMDEEDYSGEASGATANVGNQWDFATGLVKRMVAAILNGTTFSGNYTATDKSASCSGSYNDEDTQDSVSWDKSGTKSSTSRIMPELPTATDSSETGDDPDNIAPDESAPRDHTVYGAFWTTDRTTERFHASFTVSVKSENNLQTGVNQL